MTHYLLHINDFVSGILSHSEEQRVSDLQEEYCKSHREFPFNPVEFMGWLCKEKGFTDVDYYDIDLKENL